MQFGAWFNIFEVYIDEILLILTTLTFLKLVKIFCYYFDVFAVLKFVVLFILHQLSMSYFYLPKQIKQLILSVQDCAKYQRILKAWLDRFNYLNQILLEIFE